MLDKYFTQLQNLSIDPEINANHTSLSTHLPVAEGLVNVLLNVDDDPLTPCCFYTRPKLGFC